MGGAVTTDDRDPGEQLPMDPWQERLLPSADLFMVLMWSRPPSGTLRTTRVTLATIILGFAVTLAIGVPSLALLVYALATWTPLLLLGAVPCLLLGLGATAVGLFGVRQRLLLRS
jgi:hypothetical protein